MEKVLQRIKGSIIKFSEVLSKILDVDVEIVDENLVRIAGTGIFNEKVNVDMSNEGYVYKKVIESGTRMIIENPGFHFICGKCPKYKKCEELYEMSVPIKINEKVIGVIGLVCFTEKQRNHIIHNYNVFLEFLELIADLIALEAQQELKNQRNRDFIHMLEKILNKIDEGVIIFDEKNKVIRTNAYAERILKKEKKDILYKEIELVDIEEYFMDKKKYILKVGKDSYNLTGTIYKIHFDNNTVNQVFMFEDPNLIKGKFIAATSVRENFGLDKILTDNPEMIKLKEKVKKISRTASTVLITGESGTGKELFARAIHEEGTRADGPFIALNCAAIPDTLLESELFGYVKGAFTGADPKGKIGKIELADKGILFLDEIGDMPLYLQAKLLRVLEHKEIYRIGSSHPVPVDIQVISATNKNLEEMIKENKFREDLYYRLNVIPIKIPPLVNRKEDIKKISCYFVDKYSKLFEKTIKGIEDNVLEYFYSYSWPGNVRELQNVIEYAVNMTDEKGTITLDKLPASILTINKNENEYNLDKIEKDIIYKALTEFGRDLNSKKIVAEKLGIGIATLYRKMKKYGLS